jgi:hypothetical protein
MITTAWIESFGTPHGVIHTLFKVGEPKLVLLVCRHLSR